MKMWMLLEVSLGKIFDPHTHTHTYIHTRIQAGVISHEDVDAAGILPWEDESQDKHHILINQLLRNYDASPNEGD
jgi:hypothetical protein